MTKAYLGVNHVEKEGEMDVDYYLRVETSRGTMRLRGDDLPDGGLVFNWIVFEEDTTIYSTQLYREMIPDIGGFIEEEPVREKTVLAPDEAMYFVRGCECGCFIERHVTSPPRGCSAGEHAAE
jgi:hypothetical protein